MCVFVGKTTQIRYFYYRFFEYFQKNAVILLFINHVIKKLNFSAPKENPVSEEGFGLNDVADKSVDKISLTNPVGDFQIMIGKASSAEEMINICNQLCSAILHLVTESFLDQQYQKAMNCIQELRAHCSKVEKEELFNNLMGDLESTCVGKRRQDFWDLLTHAGVKAFARDGDLTENTNDNKDNDKEMEPSAPVEDDMGEDAEDLLDLL